MNIANIKATGIPDTLEQYQLALDCAVAAGQAALLAKLRGGVEMPAPTARFNWNLGKFEWLVTFKHSEHHLKPLYSHDRLLQYGDARTMAAREQRETCTWTEQDDKDMPGTYESSCGEMWSFIDGGVKENRVTYCHHCGGKVVPASPLEQQP